MHSPLKKPISYTNTPLKKSRKLISILIVFLLLTTVLSSVVSSDSVRLNSETEEDLENNDRSESPLKKLLEGNSLKERLSGLKEKLRSLRYRVSQLKDRLSGIKEDETVENQSNAKKANEIFSKTSLLKTLRSFMEFKNTGSLFVLYTNYNGIENEAPLRLFKEVNVDVDNDGVDDISAKMVLYPFIERPLCLSIYFKLVITRLPGFPDENANFSVYTELRFLGILNARQKGDRIRFGYISPEGEEVPDSCVVTYKYLPHILSPERPEHKAELDPGSSVGKARLVLLLSYTNFEGETVVSELCSRVDYDKAVKSEMHIWGNGILGGSTFNFERKVSDAEESQIDMYCSFTKNSTTVNGYVKDLPKKVTFTMDFGRKGHIEFDTYGEPPSEIGICDTLEDPRNYVYFTDLPSKARLEWERNLLFGKKAYINFYTEGPSISFNGHFEPGNGTLDFSVSSNENLNCSMELDLSEGYFVIDRTEVDLSLSLSAKGSNNGTLDLSFNVSREYINPFEIYFKIDHKIEVTLANKSFVITDFYLLVNISKLDFGIKADKLVKNQSGFVTIILDYQKNGANVTFNFTVEMEKGLEIIIYGLYIKFNGEWAESPWGDPLIITQSQSFKLNFKFYDFEYYVADDWSWGYFFFRGSISYETYRDFEIDGIPGAFKGKIYAGSDDDGLNISWYTDTSKEYNLTKFNVTGIVFGLEDFHFYFGEYINFSISKLEGSVEIVEACNESGSVLFGLLGTQSFLDINVSFNFPDISGFNFTLNVDDFHVDISDSTVSLDIIWLNSSLSSIEFHSISDVNVGISDFDLDISLANETSKLFLIENLTGYFVGYAGFDVNLSFPLNVLFTNETKYVNFSEHTFALNLSDADIFLHIDDVNLFSMDIGMIEVSANVTGTASISLINVSIEDNFVENYSLRWINTTLGIDAQDGDLDLNLLEVENFHHILNMLLEGMLGFKVPDCHLVIENISITGYSKFIISLGMWIDVSANESFNFPSFVGLRFENEVDTVMTLDRLSLFFPTLIEDIIEFLPNLENSLPEGLLEFLEKLLENLTDSPPTIYVENVKLVEGIFDLYLRMVSNVELKISNGSAVETLDLGLELPGLIKITGSVNEPLDYLDLDWNTENGSNPFIFLDTQNTTVSLDLYAVANAEFINISIAIFNEIFNSSLPYAKNDFGIRINNITLQADGFYIYLNKSAFPKFEGYIHVEGEGSIDLLINGTWESIINEGWFSVTLYPGHLQLKFDVEVDDFPIYFNQTLENGTELILSGNVSANMPNLTLDLWWSYTEDNYPTFEKFEITGMGYISIEDFLFKIGNIINVTFKSFSTKSLPNIYSISISYIRDYLTINGSLGVSIELTGLYLKLDPSVLDLGINATVEVPYLDVTFEVEEAQLMFSLIPLIIQPQNPTIGIEETVELKAIGALETVIWISENEEIATVESVGYNKGLVTGHNPGVATIVAWSGERKATTTVTVRKDFFITPEEKTIFVNETLQLIPHNQVDPVTWKSSDSEIASVNDTGLVTGLKVGNVTITATDYTGAEATSNITVEQPGPHEFVETKLYVQGKFSLSGTLKMGLNLVLVDEGFFLTGLVNGSVNLSNAYLKLVGSKNMSLEIIIPNKLEIKDGLFELRKDNETSPGLISFGGVIKISPGESDDWGNIGLGARWDNLTNNTNIFKFVLESFYLNVNSSKTPGGSDPYDPETSQDGRITIKIDPESGQYELHSENDSISLSLTNLSFNLINLIKGNEGIINSVRGSVGSLTFNKLGEIDWLFDIGRGNISSDPSERGNQTYGSYIRLKHYSYLNSYIYLRKFYLGANITVVGVNLGWIDLPIINWLNLTKSKQGYEYLALEWKKDSFYKLSVDMNSTWNCSISVGPFLGQHLQGDWYINSIVSSNWTFYIEPGTVNYAVITIHEPGLMRFFELYREGWLDTYFGLTIEPIQLTPGTIIFEWVRNNSGPLKSSGWLKIDDQDVYSEGELIKLDLTRSWAITLGTFEIDPGTLNLSWNLEDNSEYKWLKIKNEGMHPNFGLLKIKKRLREINLMELFLEPGETYIEVKKNTDSGYVYIDNTAPVELVALEVMWGTDFFKIGCATKIQVKTGKFNVAWENLTNDPKFDYQYVINNDIFDVERLDLIIKVGNLEVSFDKRDFNFSDYDNTITVKLRKRGLPGCMDNAIYVDTTDYIEMTRTTITVSYEGEELFKLETFINLAFKFNQWYIGFFNGKFEHGGKIIPKLSSGNIIAILNLSWKNDNNELQKINIHGFMSPKKANLSIDATDCTEDITLNWTSLELGNYEITGSFILPAQRYIVGELKVDVPDNPSGGDTGNWRIYFDTGAQDFQPLTEISLKIVREEKGRGLDITVELIKADKFWISGECIYIESLDKWIPRPLTIDHGGEIDIVDIIIKITLNNNNWITIWPLGQWDWWPWNEITVFVYGIEEGVAGEPLEFQVFEYGGTAPYTYTWDFGDGETSDQKNPSHTFEIPGTYTVALTVVDENSIVGTTTETVQIADRQHGNNPL